MTKSLFALLLCTHIAFGQITPANNAELQNLYNQDQSDRLNGPINWSEVSQRDLEREARVYELLDSNKVITAKDYHNAAMIFQHGQDSVAYGMAVKLMRKSLELDPKGNKWLLAAAIDRDLMSRDKPQIYGTQYSRLDGDSPWYRYELDSTVVTDKERIEHRVETLAQQREKTKRMNQKKLGTLLQDGKSVDEIIAFIKKQDDASTEYDISENAINDLGYNILKSGKTEEALKIFKLNTILYPKGFNTHDSYGECLLLLGKNEAAKAAYQKSLDLNPKNDHAKKVIEELN